MTRRTSLLLAIVFAAVAGLAALVVNFPMAQAVRWLSPASDGILVPLAASGRWHDGMLHVGCATPAGRLFDCGRYAVQVEPAKSGLTIVARQPGNGSVRIIVDLSGRRAEAIDWRLPAAALAAWLPVVEQLQMGGEMLVSGEAQDGGKIALTVRWQGEIGEFLIGEQTARIEGTAQRFSLRFVPGGAGFGAVPDIRLEGDVACEATSSGSGARCNGEIFVVSAGRDKRLDQLLAATGRLVGPGRYRFKVDA